MHKAPYTAAQRTKMARLWANGASQAEIAFQMGRTLYAVIAFMSANREYFPIRQRRLINDAEAARLKAQGLSMAQIADAMGFKPITVYVALRRYEAAA